MESYYAINTSQSLYHHGVKGMHWGQRRYQNKDGSLTPAGKVHYGGVGDDFQKMRGKGTVIRALGVSGYSANAYSRRAKHAINKFDKIKDTDSDKKKIKAFKKAYNMTQRYITSETVRNMELSTNSRHATHIDKANKNISAGEKAIKNMLKDSRLKNTVFDDYIIDYKKTDTGFHQIANTTYFKYADAKQLVKKKKKDAIYYPNHGKSGAHNISDKTLNHSEDFF